jgi:small nuclear ribonucleoprotein D2
MSRAIEKDATGREEEEEEEEEDFGTGPLSFLMISIKRNTQVLINLCNNKKLLAHSHHMVVWLAAGRLYPSCRFHAYALLGDDIVIVGCF